MSASTIPQESREGVATPVVSLTRYELSLCVKIKAILDDASNETFLNEEVAGVLGIQEPFQKDTVELERISE